MVEAASSERAEEPSAGQPSGRSAFPQIASYAFLSDCHTNCLIAPSGAVEWMCLPRPDSPSIFTALLDRSAGAFRIGPYDEMVPAARHYLPGSLVVDTTWQTRTGWLLVRDALCIGPWHNIGGTVRHRPPMLCHGPMQRASRTRSQPVRVCQVVSTTRLPGR